MPEKDCSDCINDFQLLQFHSAWSSMIDSYCEDKGIGQLDRAALYVLAELDVEHSLGCALGTRTRLDNTRDAWNGEHLFGCDLAYRMMADDKHYRRQMHREYITFKKEAGHPLQNSY